MAVIINDEVTQGTCMWSPATSKNSMDTMWKVGASWRIRRFSSVWSCRCSLIRRLSMKLTWLSCKYFCGTLQGDVVLRLVVWVHLHSDQHPDYWSVCEWVSWVSQWVSEWVCLCMCLCVCLSVCMCLCVCAHADCVGMCTHVYAWVPNYLLYDPSFVSTSCVTKDCVHVLQQYPGVYYSHMYFIACTYSMDTCESVTAISQMTTYVLELYCL